LWSSDLTAYLSLHGTNPLKLWKHIKGFEETSLFGSGSFFIGIIETEQLQLLFSAIENRGITLRSWEWNSRFLETDELVEMMVRMPLRYSHRVIIFVV
jgi:hypothetical protein